VLGLRAGCRGAKLALWDQLTGQVRDIFIMRRVYRVLQSESRYRVGLFSDPDCTESPTEQVTPLAKQYA
jgi:hypothetical protein